MISAADLQALQHSKPVIIHDELTLSQRYPNEMLPVRVIPLTQGQFAIVDPEDYAAVSAYKWYANKNRYTFYAHSFDQHFVSMHTLITGFARTDHANRSGTDNRRSNLRFASCSQNTANSRLRRDNQAGYKGVFFCKSEMIEAAPSLRGFRKDGDFNCQRREEFLIPTERAESAT